MSSSETESEHPVRKRRRINIASVNSVDMLEDLVLQGLQSDVPTSIDPDSGEDEELLDFDGSDIADPDYDPNLDSDDDESDDDEFHNTAGPSSRHIYMPSQFETTAAGDSEPSIVSNTQDAHVIGPGGDRITDENMGLPGGSVTCTPPTGSPTVVITATCHESTSSPSPIHNVSTQAPTTASNCSQLGCTWNNDNEHVTLSQSATFPNYSQTEKINIDITNPSPQDIFLHFIPEEFWEYVATETNRYALQTISSSEPCIKSRCKEWIPTNSNEMKKFVGIIICMGLVPCPNIVLYWSKNNLYTNQLIKNAMPRDRFILLKKFWHFSNNQDTQGNKDRLAKIRILVEYLTTAFMEVMVPGKDLVIDETMIPWRGRLIFKQYIKNKSHKYGVKLYKLCTPDGYTLRVSIYAGKNNTEVSKYGHTYDVAMELMGPFDENNVHYDGYLNAGRCLYTDNFYTGVQIAETLLQHQTRMCGTLNPKRKGLPVQITQTKLKKGQSVGFTCQHGTKVIRWMDKRNVDMLSTVPDHASTLIDTGKKNRKNEEILKPQCVLDYNNAKKGVDYSDQMASYYTTLRKSLKWYKKVVLELLTGTTMVNSWIVYNKITGNKMTMVQFREVVARSLLCSEDSVLTVSPFRKKNHSLGKSEGIGKKKRLRCRGCYEKNRQTLSSREADKKTKTVNTFCKDCPEKPFLCLECFNSKHK